MFTTQIALLAGGVLSTVSATPFGGRGDPLPCDLDASVSLNCSFGSTLDNSGCPGSECCVQGDVISQQDSLKISYLITLRNLQRVTPSSGSKPIQGSLSVRLPANSICGTSPCGSSTFLVGSELNYSASAGDENQVIVKPHGPGGEGWPGANSCVSDARGFSAGGDLNIRPLGGEVYLSGVREVIYSVRAPLDGSCNLGTSGSIGTFYGPSSSASFQNDLEVEPVDPLVDSELGVQVAIGYKSEVNVLSGGSNQCGAITRCADASGDLVMSSHRVLIPVVIEYATGSPTRAVVGGTVRVKSGGSYEMDGIFNDPGFSISSIGEIITLEGSARCCIASDPLRTPTAVRILSASTGTTTETPGDLNGDGKVCWDDLALIGFMLEASSFCEVPGIDVNEDDVFDSDDRAALYAILAGYDCPADINCDGFVDFFDYDQFMQYFEGPLGFGADFNGDGYVDFFDFDDFIVAFETSCD